MEGLEISEVLRSSLDKTKLRIDAEYYKKAYLLLSAKLKSIGELNISETGCTVDCSAFYPSITEHYNFDHKGVPFLRVNEIKNGLVSITDNTAFLPQSILDKNTSTIAIGHPGDIVIAKGGNTLAKVGLITDRYSSYALSRDIILVRTVNLLNYNNFFLWVFLHSKYGQDLLWRSASQTGQPHLTLPSIKEIDLPKYSNALGTRTENLYTSSLALKQKSCDFYSQAERLLLEEIGLLDFEPSQEPVNIKSFQESFGTSGRLDAEYYQKKYDDLEAVITKNNHYEMIKHIRVSNFRGLQPKYDVSGELSVINSKHILETSLDYGNFNKVKSNYWEDQKKARVFKNDILTYTTGANIGRTQVYLRGDKALASNHVNILRLKPEYNSIYIGFVMNSLIGRLQTEKLSAGSAQAELYPKDIDNFLIPIIDHKKQQKIVFLIEKSFALKKQSEHLLEVAKRAVEIAIEENEDVALAYIDKEAGELL